MSPALEPSVGAPYAMIPVDAIDFEVFYEVVLQLGVEGVAMLLGTLVDDGCARIDRIHAAIAADNWSAVGKEAHALKSGSGTFGLIGVAAKARALELACRAGVGPAEQGALDGLAEALHRGIAALRERLA